MTAAHPLCRFVDAGQTVGRARLLDELQADYPGIAREVVAEVLDRAFLAARLGTGAEDVPQRFVVVVARDRLDVLRARATPPD